MTVFYYKLCQKKPGEFLTGFASEVVVGDGRILLRDRRVPLAAFNNGVLGLYAHALGDLELETENEQGWAAWAYETPVPGWWVAQSPAASSLQPAETTPDQSDGPP